MLNRLVVFALVLSVACNSSTPVRTDLVTVDTLPGGIIRTMSRGPADSGNWHLVLESSLRPAEGAAGELVDPNDLALADDGTLYVADTKPTGVKVFGASGELLRTIGRDGEGPGEIRSAWIATRGDTLVVHDPRLGRSNTFSARDGVFLRMWRTSAHYYGPIGIDGQGHGVVPTVIQGPIDSTVPMGYARFTLGTESVDTVKLQRHANPIGAMAWSIKDKNGRLMMTATVPLRPRDFYAVDPGAGFVTGWSGEYLLRTTRNGRDTTSLFGRAWTPEPVDGGEKAQITKEQIASVVKANDGDVTEAQAKSGFSPDAIPDQRPAFDGIWRDRAGRTWVRLIPRDTINVHFDLFDERGRWLDHVLIPRRVWTPDSWRSVAWSRDHVAVIVNDESGKPTVNVFKIVHGSTP